MPILPPDPQRPDTWDFRDDGDPDEPRFLTVEPSSLSHRGAVYVGVLKSGRTGFVGVWLSDAEADAMAQAVLDAREAYRREQED